VVETVSSYRLLSGDVEKSIFFILYCITIVIMHYWFQKLLKLLFFSPEYLVFRSFTTCSFLTVGRFLFVLVSPYNILCCTTLRYWDNIFFHSFPPFVRLDISFTDQLNYQLPRSMICSSLEILMCSINSLVLCNPKTYWVAKVHQCSPSTFDSFSCFVICSVSSLLILFS
jgi:hypothetical protein